MLNPEYNILRIARSSLRHKHSSLTKLKLTKNKQAFLLIVKNIKTGKIYSFSSIRRTGNFINIHHSYIAKCIRNKKFYRNKYYYVTKS